MSARCSARLHNPLHRPERVATYLILTSKPGVYRTEPGPHCYPVAAFDYVWLGKLRARFVIARLDAPTRLRVIDEGVPETVNSVPSKFMPGYETMAAARHELQKLADGGGADAHLTEAPLG